MGGERGEVGRAGSRAACRVLIYTLGVALVLALAADKYSFGEFESAKLVPEAAIRVLWQVLAAGVCALLITAALLASRSAPRAAFLLACIESIVYASANGVLYARDGYFRFADWDYGHSETRLQLFVVGILLRATILWQLQQLRIGRSTSASDQKYENA